MNYVYNLDYIMWGGGRKKKEQQNPQKFPNKKPS